MDHLVTTIGSTLALIVGVALAATLVSKNAQTGAILTQGGNAFASILKAAEGPVGSGFTSG